MFFLDSFHVVCVCLPGLVADGSAILNPLPGARVHINGVLISAGAEAFLCEGTEGKCGVPPPGFGHEQGGGMLQRDCRVLFGSRHFFRVHCDDGPPGIVSWATLPYHEIPKTKACDHDGGNEQRTPVGNVVFQIRSQEAQIADPIFS